MKLFKHPASNSNSKLIAKARTIAARFARSHRDSCLETLEGRTLFSTFVVNVAGDPTTLTPGQTSLRKAVIEANATSGVSTIKFKPAVFSTPQTIDLRAPLVVSNPAAKISILGPAAQLTLNQDLDFVDAETIVVKPNATLTVARLNLTNDAVDSGSEVVKNAGNLEMVNCTISSTSNQNGIRAIFNTGLLKLGRVTIADHGDGNSDIPIGGGLYNDGGKAELVGVSFNSDDAGVGGAIGQTGGTLDMLNVTINNCGADTNGLGGAMAIEGGNATLVNSTIANSFMLAEGVPTGAKGIAIYAESANVLLLNDTITNSQLFPLGFGDPSDVPTSGSIYIAAETKFHMGNTVVSGMNEVGGFLLDTGPEIIGHVLSLGHNFIGQTGPQTSGLVATDLVGTHAAPLDPELNDLANNGGYVQTELPRLGSPLINAGDNTLVPSGITNDARGQARITGGIVDIGAVETDYVIKRVPIVVNPFKG